MVASLKDEVLNSRVADKGVIDEVVKGQIAKGKRDNGGIWNKNTPVDVSAIGVRGYRDMKIGNIKTLEGVEPCKRQLADNS